jgi:hypothetical protein
MRAGADDDALTRLIAAAVAAKHARLGGHATGGALADAVAAAGGGRPMIRIGG